MSKREWHPTIELKDLPIGSRKIVELASKSVGLFNVNGSIVAILNLCPHEFAPVCQGRVSGTTAPSLPGEPFQWEREGEILYCPWHGWEFDLLTGECLTDYRKLRRYPTQIIDGWINVQI